MILNYGRYDTIMIFNVPIGTSWTGNAGYGSYKTTLVDAGYNVVDYISLYYFRLRHQSTSPMNSFDEVSDFYQVLGNLDGNFVFSRPYIENDVPVDNALRCMNYLNGSPYELTFSLTHKPCDYLPQVSFVSTEEISFDKIQVVNPAINGLVQFQHVSTDLLQDVWFYDAQGKRVDISYIINNNTYHQGKSTIALGIYFYQLHYSDGRIEAGKVWVE